MINVTDQVNEHPNRKDMPTVGEFDSAKLTDAFSTLGENFGKGKDRLAIKKDIFEANTALETKAKMIGHYVVTEVAQGNEYVTIPSEYIYDVKALQAKIQALKNKLG